MFCKILHAHCLVWQLLSIGVFYFFYKNVVFDVFVFGVLWWYKNAVILKSMTQVNKLRELGMHLFSRNWRVHFLVVLVIVMYFHYFVWNKWFLWMLNLYLLGCIWVWGFKTRVLRIVVSVIVRWFCPAKNICDIMNLKWYLKSNHFM